MKYCPKHKIFDTCVYDLANLILAATRSQWWMPCEPKEGAEG